MFLDTERLRVGGFNLDDENLNEMARVGRIEKFDYNIYVYENDDGQIPHFHIINTEKKMDCCVRIEENKYFKHGKHQSELNNKERKALDKLLNSMIEDFNMNHWQLIRYTWNLNNNRKEVKTKIQPDYRTIEKG